MIDYLDVFRYPDMYQLLAIGNRPDDKSEWEWGVITRFLKGTDKKKIENFMCNCGEGVNPRCKYSALYDVEEIIFVRLDGREEKHDPRDIRHEEVLN